MMKIIKMVRNSLFILIFIFTAGCSGTFFGFHNLDKKYEEEISNSDIELYYTASPTYIAMAVRNVSNTFFTGLNMSLECVYKNGDETSIATTECLVPWYTDSTNQSQYGEFVKDGGTYKLRNTQSTTIENSTDLYVMVNENDSSFMGVMLQDKHSKKITDMFLV